MTVGDRVWLVEDIEQHNRIVVGTVKRVSPAGYVRVWWDEVYPVSDFSPMTALTRLRVVTGDDALPRHDWDCQKDQIDPPCLRCGVIQTDKNEHMPCRGAAGEDRSVMSEQSVCVHRYLDGACLLCGAESPDVEGRAVVSLAWLAALQAAQPMLRQVLEIFEAGSRDENKERARAVRAALLPTEKENNND